MNDKLPVVRRAIEAKRNRPEYQRLDIEPETGGKSLLHDEHGLPPFSDVGSNYASIEAYPNETDTLVESDIIKGPAPVLSDGFLYYHGYGVMNAVASYNACEIVGHTIQFGQVTPGGAIGANQFAPGLNRWFVYDLDA